MAELTKQEAKIERALLVGAYRESGGRDEAENLLSELTVLVETLGIKVLEQLCVRIAEPSPRLFVGSGKGDEICERARQAGAQLIVFDNELSPGQQRNWETKSKLPVIDRQEVILDIFAERAQTREARLQVDLARLEYSLPRLTRAWGHLSRQGGGFGAKGEGETQLETDRRLVRRQIDRVKEDLERVRSRRATQRKQRERLPLPQAAIVGYTNAGKSSLLRRLTGADVLVADKLFATLDPTTRKVDLPSGQGLLLTDTVGFVRNLPHRLVEAFKATLEETVQADFLVHVLDASHPQVYDFHATTMEVLSELGADQKRILTVLNKIDLQESEAALHGLRLHFPEGLFVSVQTGQGLDDVLNRMADLLSDRLTRVELALPLERGDLLSLLHRAGRVIQIHYQDNCAKVVATVSPKVLARVEPFLACPSRRLQLA
jgi:GTP-binding protein HflX